eukprot:PhF_6_TR44493/c0_g1_i1/m.68525/K13179/DDX18, HAS1; ATP-dependent RNA helicase DDX18/HAS1
MTEASGSTFRDITPPIDPVVIKALEETFKFTAPTPIQAATIPHLLTGKSAKAQAETGGGKTLSFLIPIVCRMRREKVKFNKVGTYAFVLTPTRELAQQIEGVLETLLANFHGQITWTSVIGGTKRSKEAEKLTVGANIVIATPGRLLDHMQTVKDWTFSNLKVFCIDEADRVLENGFEEALTRIIELLPNKDSLQVMLFSATQDHAKNQDLEKVTACFGALPFISTTKHSSDVVDTLQHGFVTVAPDLKFLLLYTLLRKYTKQNLKVVVFFASCNEVKFFADLLNYIDIPCVPLHGQMKQSVRSSTFFQFCNATSAILLTTDVAARGLDFPAVDWVVQYDAPDSVTKYVHRVGRTARGVNATGNALLMLLPQETDPFLAILTSHLTKPLQHFAFDEKKLSLTLMDELLRLVAKNYYLHRSAHEAYKSFLQSYATHSLKSVFNVYDLDVAKVARGFGLEQAPIVDLGLSESALRRSRMKRVRGDAD